MTVVLGALSVLLGLLAWLTGAHVKSRRYYDRPAPARGRLFLPLVAILHWTLVILGLILLGRSSAAVALVVATVLLALWGLRRFLRSAAFQRRLLRREVEALRSAHPDLAERAILCRVVLRRHPRWGEELVEQIVADYPTIDALAGMMARMERGFRGVR